jgi:amino acid transporter
VDDQSDVRRKEQELHAELGELLNAIRVALPGVQVLFAFLIAVPFSNRFQKVTTVEEDTYIAALLCAATASVLLIAPSAHHRLHWRLPVEERALQWANRLLILGTLFLALATVGAAFFVTDVLLGLKGSIPIACTLAILAALIWYALPLAWRNEADKRGERSPKA